MSSPFDVQVPAWLQHITERNAEHGQWGNIAGTALAGLFNAVSNDESFAEGVGDARAQQVNPLNRLQAAAVQSQLVGEAARAQTLFSNLNEQKRERAAWLADAPKVVPWLTASPQWRKDHPEARPRDVQSTQAIEGVQTADKNDDTFWIKDADNKTRLLKAQSDTQSKKSFYDQLAKLPDDLKSGINAVRPLQDGNISPEQWSALSAAQTAAGKRLDAQKELARKEAADKGMDVEFTFDPKGQLITKYKPKKSATLSTFGKLLQERDAAEAAGDKTKLAQYDAQIKKANLSAEDMEKLRMDNWLVKTKERLKAKLFEDKFRAALKNNPSEDTFVSQHLNTFIGMLSKSNAKELKAPDGSLDEQKVAHGADSLLRMMYREGRHTAPQKPDWLTTDIIDDTAPSGAADKPDRPDDPDKTPSGLNYSIEPLK